MKLTGKALADFENWFIKTEGKDPYWIYKDLTASMRWGIYVDFFDSKYLMIGVRIRQYDSLFLAYVNWDAISLYETRTEARKAAIKKANEIYNQQAKNATNHRNKGQTGNL